MESTTTLTAPQYFHVKNSHSGCLKKVKLVKKYYLFFLIQDMTNFFIILLVASQRLPIYSEVVLLQVLWEDHIFFNQPLTQPILAHGAPIWSAPKLFPRWPLKLYFSVLSAQKLCNFFDNAEVHLKVLAWLEPLCWIEPALVYRLVSIISH